ncbi:hypothetical protein BSNK01_28320 [Bacillaceae bacterium]
MSVRIVVNLDYQDAVNRLAALGVGARPAATRALMIFGQELVTAIKDRVTEIGLVDTGRLRSSTTFRLLGPEHGEVGVRVHYAAIHEYGGVIKPRQTKPWIITPKRAQMLRFEIGGKTVFARRVVQQPKLVFEVGGKKVFAKSVTIREKRYVRDPLERLANEGRFEEIVVSELQRLGVQP